MVTALLLGVASCGDAASLQAAEDEASCRDGPPEAERHGADCLCCHRDSFTVAGSVARDDSAHERGLAASDAIELVVVVDSAGQRTTMGVNPYGNFFQHVPIRPPLRAAVVLADGSERWMGGQAPHGSCNRCHWEAGQARPLGASPID
jgi:hypothetical protein